MNAKLTLLSGRLLVEASGADIKNLFREIGTLADVFEADTACSACGSIDIRPNCRVIDGYEYFSLHCTACSSELSFGQRRDGGLFPRRKDEDGHWLPDGGWKRYQSRTIDAPAFPSGPPGN